MQGVEGNANANGLSTHVPSSREAKDVLVNLSKSTDRVIQTGISNRGPHPLRKRAEALCRGRTIPFLECSRDCELPLPPNLTSVSALLAGLVLKALKAKDR